MQRKNLIRTAGLYRYIRGTEDAGERFEWFPFVPVVQNENCYDELTFAPSLARRYDPGSYDVTVMRSDPVTNLALDDR
jgi:hypothetical protein